MAKKSTRNTRGRIVSAAWKLFYEQRSVAKLAEDGFLIKEKKSGRSYRLTLTPLGKQAFDVCHQVLFDWDATKLTGLTNEEQQLLLNLLCKISIQKV